MLAAPQKAMSSRRRVLDTAETLLESAERELRHSHILSAKRHLLQIQRIDDGVFTRDVAFVSRFLRALAIVYRDTNNIEAAIGAYSQLEILSRDANKLDLLSEAIIGKAMILINNDRISLAERVLMDHRQELDSMPSQAFRAEYENWKVCLLEQQNEIEAARECMNRLVLPLSENYEPEDLQIARHAVASRLALAGRNRQWKIAEKELEKASDLITRETPLLRQGQFLQGRALFELKAGDIDSAHSLAIESERIFQVDGIVSHQLRRLRKQLGEI